MTDQIKQESDAVLAWIRARPKIHDEMQGYAQVVKTHGSTSKIGKLAQKRFNDMYEQACKAVGVQI